MPANYSAKQMLDKCEGLIGTDDINDWETAFLQSLIKRMRTYQSDLTVKQMEHLKKIHDKHFA